MTAEDDAADALVYEVQQKAKDAGLWAPHLPPEAGGSGSGFLEYAHLNEEIGRSFVAQLIFGCQAPDAGNAEILHLYGTDEQKERFLRPLVAGEVRSFFGMTEPEVAGSDPTLLRGRAERDGDEWVIDAHKWFSSGADGAAFGIVMVVTDPDAEPHRRASMILVPTDTPGYELVRKIPVMGHEGRGWGTHGETRFTNVRVPFENVLGEPGDGFRIAQKRLGPGRIHHVMRWLGQMQRAFELMCSYALERKAARRDVAPGARRPHLRRPRRGAQDGGGAPDPPRLRGRRHLALHVTLEGERVRLEPLEPRHEEALWEVAQDARVWRFMRERGGESRDPFAASFG